MHIDEMFAEILWRAESSVAVTAGLVDCGVLVHGGNVLLQVVEITDDFVTMRTTLWNFS